MKIDERTNRAYLEHELKLAGAVITGSSVKCPFHPDGSPSGGIYQGADSVWRYKCHAGSCGFQGDILDVRAKRTGKELREIVSDALSPQNNSNIPLPPRKSTGDDGSGQILDSDTVFETYISQFRNLESVYKYENGLIVIRYRNEETEKKSFSQAHWEGERIVPGAGEKPWMVYNLLDVKKSDIVVVVEGEKCCEVLKELGFAATTSPCGAQNASSTDWSPLSGKKVYLWPDNDEGGRKYMQTVAGVLKGLEEPPEIFFIEPDDLSLQTKEDVADFVSERYLGISNNAKKRKIIQSIFDEASPYSESSGLFSLLMDTISGKRRAYSWVWKSLKITKALFPGDVVVFCGKSGATKSFFILQAFAYWYEQGIPVAIYELEDDADFHLYRALAQKIQLGELLDDEWVRENGETVKGIYENHKKWLDGLRGCMWDNPDDDIALSQLVFWLEDRCKEGAKIVIIDPVTAAKVEGNQWTADFQFIMAAKRIARRYGARVVLVTHPKKGSKGFSFEDLAGGAAYSRFVHTVLWLERLQQPGEVFVLDAMGRHLVTINRTVHILKARNGKTQGNCIGMNFKGDTLCFSDEGIVVDEK